MEATGGIGALGDAEDIDISAISIDARATGSSGDVSIAKTNGSVELGGTTQVTFGTGGSIQVTADNGSMTVISDVNTTGNGEIRLEATNSDLTVNSGVTIESVNGKIRLATGSGTLTLEDTDISTRSVVRTGNADIELAVNDLVIQNNDSTGTAQIVVGGGNDIVFLPTFGRSIGLGGGGATGDFQLDDSEIAALRTSGSVRFGAVDNQVGEVRIDTADFSRFGGLELFSNGSISDSGADNPFAPDQLQAQDLRLDAGTGVGDSGNLLNTAVVSIDARASGGIYIDETDDLALGRVDASTNAITIEAGGAITDKDPAAEGAGNENLVGRDINLLAATGIGAPGGADIDTRAVSISASTNTGGIYIDETDDVVLGNLSAGGAVSLTAQGSVALGQIKAGTSISITAKTDAISDITTDENANLIGSDVTLLAATGIGLSTPRDADIDVAAANIDAQTADGGIFINVADETTFPEPEISESDIPDEPPPSIPGIEIPDKWAEPEKIPNDTIWLQMVWLIKIVDSTFSSVDDFLNTPADILVLPEYDGVLPGYGVPDYGAGELDLLHLSGANESLWENEGKSDDEPEVSGKEEFEEE